MFGWKTDIIGPTRRICEPAAAFFHEHDPRRTGSGASSRAVYGPFSTTGYMIDRGAGDMTIAVIFAFIAAVILGGGLVVAGLTHVPRLLLAGNISDNLPRWTVIMASYLVALLALKIFGSFFPYWSLLLTFAFGMITLHHLYWSLQEPGAGAAVAICSISVIAMTLVMLGMRGIYAAMPMEGIARVFT